MEKKMCSICKTEHSINKFSVNDYGKPYSSCKDAQNIRQIENYRKKKELKESAEIILSEDSTTECVNENVYKKEIKCKSFFFYQHT